MCHLVSILFYIVSIKRYTMYILNKGVAIMQAIIITHGYFTKRQIELCERYAEIKGYEILFDTQNLNAVMYAAENKKFNVLLYTHIDALGDVNNSARNIEHFRNYGIEVNYITEKKIKEA